ncbi:MAG: PHB depolymerase family esterase [Deltaproteobacteria bacterium]|nr:PHB depolymerase family esterase [Deltaproteobacteria bacterium]
MKTGGNCLFAALAAALAIGCATARSADDTGNGVDAGDSDTSDGSDTGSDTDADADADTDADTDADADADTDSDTDGDTDGDTDADADSDADTDADTDSDSNSGTDSIAGCPPGSGDGPLGGSRPTNLKIPSGYDATQKYPLVIELHGRGGKGTDAESVFKMKAMANANGLFVIAPDGTLDSPPSPTAPATFWNATDGCCDNYGSNVDDVAYLRSLICHTMTNYSIDPDKVYIIGHSNGGFMAHRMACDASDLVTAIISIAGVTWKDPSNCQPTHPVSVLQIHGTADTVVLYDGMDALFPGPAPSAEATYETWATLNHCEGTDVTDPSVDFDQSVAGNETVPVHKPASATCLVRTEFWKVVGGSHVPDMASSTKKFFIDWFKAAPANH